MSEPKTPKSAKALPGNPPPPAERAERLKAALRENLQRRKAQDRARRRPDPPENGPNRP
jgi:hypothetical protein